MASWFVRLRDRQGKPHGPFSEAQLAQLVRGGRLKADDEISCDGKTWIAAQKVAGLFSGGSAPPPAPPAKPAPNAASPRLVASAVVAPRPVAVPSARPAAPMGLTATAPIPPASPTSSTPPRRRANSVGFLATAVSIVVGGLLAVVVATQFGLIERLRGRPEEPVAYEIIRPEEPKPERPREPVRPLTPSSAPNIDPTPVEAPHAPPTTGNAALNTPGSPVAMGVTSTPPIVAEPPPSEPTLPPEPRSAPAPTPPTIGWIGEMDVLFGRMPPMREKFEKIRIALNPLLEEVAKNQERFNFLVSAGKKLRSQYNALSSDIKGLLQARGLSDGANRSAIDSQISQVRYAQGQLEIQYNTMDAECVRLKTRYAELKPQIDALQTELAPLVEEGRKLELAFLELLGPFDGTPLADADAALEYFDRGIQSERGGDASWSYLGRGCLHFRAKRHDEAFADFDTAVSLQKQQATFLAIRGFAAFVGGKEQQGRTDLVAATKLDEANCTARYYYAMVLFRSGANSTAETQLKAATTAAPNDPEAFRLLGLFKATSDVETGRNGTIALKHAQAAKLLAPNSWKSHLAMAAALAETNDFADAVKAAESAASTAPKSRRDWCRSCVETLRAGKPIRIDWKTFNVSATF